MVAGSEGTRVMDKANLTSLCPGGRNHHRVTVRILLKDLYNIACFYIKSSPSISESLSSGSSYTDAALAANILY